MEVEAGPLLAAVEGDAGFSDAEVEDLLFGVRTDTEALKPSVESLFHAWLLVLGGPEFLPPEEVIRIDERMDEHYRQRILRRSV